MDKPRRIGPWLGRNLVAVIGPGTPAGGEMKEKSRIYQDQIAQTAANT